MGSYAWSRTPSHKEGAARSLVDEVMIPAIQKVGELYEKKTYFLPQLIASAETMKRGFEYLQPRFKEEGSLLPGKERSYLPRSRGISMTSVKTSSA